MQDAAKAIRNEYHKKWNEKHRSEIREYARKWRENHRDEIREYSRNWRKAHPDKVKQYQEEYWNRKAEAAGAEQEANRFNFF